MLTKLVSEAEPRGNWWRTLVGDELEVEDLNASARGPPIEATWFVDHPAAQFKCGCSDSVLLSRDPGSSPIPVDNFNDTSDDEFPGIEIERLVAEFTGLALLPAFSDSWSDRGQSSKKWRSTWPSDFPSADTSCWASKRPPLFLVLDPVELQGTKEHDRAKNQAKNNIKKKLEGSSTKASSFGVQKQGLGLVCTESIALYQTREHINQAFIGGPSSNRCHMPKHIPIYQTRKHINQAFIGGPSSNRCHMPKHIPHLDPTKSKVTFFQ